MKFHRHFLTFALALFIAASACNLSSAQPTSTPKHFGKFEIPKAGSSATPFQPIGRTNTPPATWTSSPIPSNTPTSPPPPTETRAAPTLIVSPPTQPVPPPPANPSRPSYILYAEMDFPNRSLQVNQTIQYYNDTGLILSDMVLSVQPNRWGGVFTLHSLAQDNVIVSNFTLADQRMTISLPAPLPPAAVTTLTMSYTLALPEKGDGLFGYDFNQINLVDWYPFIVPYNNGWVLHEPSSFGEHLVYDSADIEVNIKTGADVILAAPAPAEQNGEWTRYRMYGARTFSLSASNEFLVTESAVGKIIIRSYYFSGYQAAAESILYSAKQAVALFEAKFAPYPYETLVIVQADIHDGMEYDGLIFVSSKFYGQYGGGAKNNLTTIGVHEIAHQWWFGLVGSNQAAEPWLDEALSAYSEKIFYEYNYPRYGDWWWQFRVDYFGPGGYVDSNVYSHSSYRSYVNAVYLNGAHFLDDVRVRMGDDDFFRFLKDYAARYSYKRASSADFFAVLREHTSKDLTPIIQRYFAGSY